MNNYERIKSVWQLDAEMVSINGLNRKARGRMYGTIKVKCGNQKSIIRMEMLDDNQIDVQCKFNPPMDVTKTPTMEENFVGNVTQMIMSLIYANGNIKEQTNEK